MLFSQGKGVKKQERKTFYIKNGRHVAASAILSPRVVALRGVLREGQGL